MAFLPAAAARIMRRAAAIISSESIPGRPNRRLAHEGYTVGRLFAAIKGRASGEVGYTPQAARALAVQAIQGANVGSAMMANPDYAPTARDLPLYRGLYPDEERYRYGVLVRVELAGQVIDSWITEVRSDAALSANQIDAMIRAQFDTYTSPGRSDAESTYIVPTGAIVAIEVTAAGRRP